MKPKRYYQVNIEWRGENENNSQLISQKFPKHFVGSGSGFNSSNISFMFPNNHVLEGITELVTTCRDLHKKNPSNFFDWEMFIKQDND